jgi:hypothetical protein
MRKTNNDVIMSKKDRSKKNKELELINFFNSEANPQDKK